jgi:hypothetical protein
MPATRPRNRPPSINPVVDQALLVSEGDALDALRRLRRKAGTETLAERVRQRAAVLARRHRTESQTILDARDTLILRLYTDATPRGWFTAWCDASVTDPSSDRVVGVGTLILDPNGHLVAEVSRATANGNSFAAEIIAAETTLELALARKAKRLRVHTDCRALVDLWRTHRHDLRLAPVRLLARGFDRLELRTVPRLHNQPANRLARQGSAA